MTRRVHRSPIDNKYHIGGHAYPHLVGSRRQVSEGFAYKTAGDLTKADLVRNKHGRYVSRRKHVTATREKRLLKYGYSARKGQFGAVKMTAVHKNGTSARRKTRGGGKTAEEKAAEEKAAAKEAEAAAAAAAKEAAAAKVTNKTPGVFGAPRTLTEAEKAENRITKAVDTDHVTYGRGEDERKR